jgi:tetratricopeptide (TPR) repeat protein
MNICTIIMNQKFNRICAYLCPPLLLVLCGTCSSVGLCQEIFDDGYRKNMPLIDLELQEQARKVADQEAKREPMWIARQYEKMDNYVMAIQKYREILDKHPKHHSARLCLAFAYEHIGRLEDARRTYEELWTSDRSGCAPMYLLQMASTDDKLGFGSRALQEYKEYLTLNPHPPDSVKARVIILTRDPTDTIDCSNRSRLFNQVMPAMPEEAKYRYLGAVPEYDNGRRNPYIEGPRLATVESVLRRLVDDYPENCVFALKLAAVLDDENKVAEAEEILQKAIKRTPSNGDLWYYLHYILDKQGKKEGASEALKHAKTLKPEPI